VRESIHTDQSDRRAHGKRYGLSLCASHRRKILSRLFAVLLCATAGCSSEPGGGGIGGTGKADLLIGEGLITGVITTADSDTVNVNGRSYKTDLADAVVDSQPASVNALQVGMHVRARVDHDTQRAQTIQYQPLVSGPVAQISLQDGTIIVLEQTVLIDDSTRFDGLSVDQMMPTMIVEVSGIRNSDDQIIATYISAAATSIDYYTIGKFQKLGSEPGTAVLSGTVIDFRDFLQALLLPMFDFLTLLLTPDALFKSTVQPGTYSVVQANNGADGEASGNVEISTSGNGVAVATSTGANGANGQNGITISSLTIVEQLEPKAGEMIELVGTVEELVAPDIFVIDAKRATLSELTNVVSANGASIDDLTLNVNERVVVTGLVSEEPAATDSGSDGEVARSIQVLSIELPDRLP
jgi:hypothetical protein